MVDKSGACLFDDLNGSQIDTQLKGDHITCMRANPVNPELLAFGSKDKTVQLW